MGENTYNIDNKTITREKTPVFLVLLALILIFTTLVGYYFYNNYSKQDSSNENPLDAQQEEKQDIAYGEKSIFGSILNENGSEGEKYSYEESLGLYEYYDAGDQGMPAKYVSFDRDNMTIKVGVPLGENGDFVDKEYSLADDPIFLETGCSVIFSLMVSTANLRGE